jgi:hypothetical protein
LRSWTFVLESGLSKDDDWMKNKKVLGEITRSQPTGSTARQLDTVYQQPPTSSFLQAPSTRSPNNFSRREFDSGPTYTLFETHPRLSSTSASLQVVGFCGVYIYSLFSLPSSTAFPAHLPIHFRDCDDTRDAWCIEMVDAWLLRGALPSI